MVPNAMRIDVQELVDGELVQQALTANSVVLGGEHFNERRGRLSLKRNALHGRTASALGRFAAGRNGRRRNRFHR